MYVTVLILHNIVRWAVVFTGIYALTRAFGGWWTARPWEKTDRKAGLFFMISMDVQLLLGLLLYGVLSPISRGALAQMSVAMKDRLLRYWAVEHITLALLAVIAVHVGNILGKRESVPAPLRHRRVAIAFAISVALVMLAIPWPFLPIGRPLLRLGM
jgi:hypothetical protein